MNLEEIGNILDQEYNAAYEGEPGNRLSKTDPKIFSQNERKSLIDGIISGDIESNDANSPIIEKTKQFLEERLQIGYGRGFMDDLQERDSKTLKNLRQNISDFADAKFRTQVKAIQQEIKGLSPSQARKRAETMFDTYNKKYLKAEGNVTEKQSKIAKKYNKFKDEGVKFLRYTAVLDKRTRDKHESLDGTIRSIDDDFWSSYTPPLGYNCRCDIQRVSSKGVGRPKKAPELAEDGHKQVFSRNPARTRTIFPKGKHPYFRV